MRIIGGEAGGRRLKAPAGFSVRPTADRVRQTVFDLLAFRWEGGGVLDLFAGSGALGLEALSRGASGAVFCEKGAAAVSALEANIASCGFGGRSRVMRGDFAPSVAALKREGRRFSLVFIDPPYEGATRDQAMACVAPLVEAGGWVVVETATTEPRPVAMPGWRLERERKFGRTLVFLYQNAEDSDISGQL